MKKPKGLVVKTLSLLLSMTMTLSLVPMTAIAAEETAALETDGSVIVTENVGAQTDSAETAPQESGALGTVTPESPTSPAGAVEETPVVTPEEVPATPSEETPVVTPEEVPVTPSDETPEVTPEEVPATPSEETPEVTPEETPVTPPEETPVVPPVEDSEEIPVEETPVAYMAGELTGSDGIYHVTVTVEEDAMIPEGSTLSVRELTEADAAYQDALLLVDPDDGTGFAALDISILDTEGNEIEPLDAVKVQIELTQRPADMAEDAVINIQHIDESGAEPILEWVAGTVNGAVTIDQDEIQLWLGGLKDQLNAAKKQLDDEGMAAWLAGMKEQLSSVKQAPAMMAEFTVTSFSSFAITYDTASPLTVHLITAAGNDITATVADKPGSDAYTDVTDYVPALDNYSYKEAHANTADGEVVTQIRYSNGEWQYSAGGVDTTLTALYLVYTATGSLTFDKNKGDIDAPAAIAASVGEVVTLPNYEGKREGYTFLGWSDSSTDYTASTTYRAIYTVGSRYEMTENTVTLYAAWCKTPSDTLGKFFIRKDGKIPSNEPTQQWTSIFEQAYTDEIRVENAVTVQRWVMDVDTTNSDVIGVGDDLVGNHVNNEVAQLLNNVPTDEQIKAVLPSYDPNNQYILWYIQKLSTDTEWSGWLPSLVNRWHIDGVILDLGKVNIVYDANRPAGVTAEVDTPLGYQVAEGTTINVGESGSVGSGDYPDCALTGYTFRGWNTEPDGTGTMYNNGDELTITENTTLYAIWTKGNNNVLTVNKVDALGNSVSGASFTLVSEASTYSFTAGSYTNSAIETDTVYTITETAAPNGYTGLTDPFRFVVDSDGSSLTAYFCDENGKEVSSPAGVKLAYSASTKTVTITVTNVGQFYVFHTADNVTAPTVETITLNGKGTGWNDDGTFDLTSLVTDGYLYGGYYSDYAGKGNYDGKGGFDSTPTAVCYEGDLTSWNGTKAYQQKGTAMTPEAGKTYFLKEVPSSYLNPATYVVYDKNDENRIKQLYLMTATDDKNYREVGLDVTGSASETVTTTAYQTVYINKKDTTQTLTVDNVFTAANGGYLALSENKTGYIDEGKIYTATPYFVTFDGVKVTGDQRIRIYLRDAIYQKWSAPGVTKVGIPAAITMS